VACVRRTGRVISPAVFSLSLSLSLSFPLSSFLRPSLPLLPSPPCSFFSFFFSILRLILLLSSRGSLFFFRFPMRGLETRLINIAGVAASLFSLGCRAASQLLRAIARTTHVCITSAALFSSSSSSSSAVPCSRAPLVCISLPARGVCTRVHAQGWKTPGMESVGQAARGLTAGVPGVFLVNSSAIRAPNHPRASVSPRSLAFPAPGNRANLQSRRDRISLLPGESFNARVASPNNPLEIFQQPEHPRGESEIGNYRQLRTFLRGIDPASEVGAESLTKRAASFAPRGSCADVKSGGNNASATQRIMERAARGAGR